MSRTADSGNLSPMKSRTVAWSARCSSVSAKYMSCRPLPGEPENELTDDVALHLRAAAPDRFRAGPHERRQQIVGVTADHLVPETGDIGEQLTDVLVGLAPLQLGEARRRAEFLALLGLRQQMQRVVAQALELHDRRGDLLP